MLLSHRLFSGTCVRQVGVVQQADTLMLPPSWLLSASISTLPTGAERPLPAAHADSQAARSAESLGMEAHQRLTAAPGQRQGRVGPLPPSLAGEALKEAAL